MYRFIVLSLLILAVGCPSKDSPEPQPPAKNYLKVGRAPYAIQQRNHNCNLLFDKVKNMDRDFHYSWLYSTFDNVSGNGSYLECVYRLNGLPQTTLMEVSLTNEVCQRNNRCGGYEFLSGISVKDYANKLKARDKNLLAKLDAYIKTASERILPTLRAETRCLISPGLESNLDSSAASVLIEYTRKHFSPRCEIVWNPLHGSPIAGTIFEQHGINPSVSPPCVVNLDGKDIDLNVRKSYYSNGSILEKDLEGWIRKYQHCEAVFMWLGEDNCVKSPGSFVDPRNRPQCTNEVLENALQPYLMLEK
jgi:hypothetical protein